MTVAQEAKFFIVSLVFLFIFITKGHLFTSLVPKLIQHKRPENECRKHLLYSFNVQTKILGYNDIFC